MELYPEDGMIVTEYSLVPLTVLASQQLYRYRGQVTTATKTTIHTVNTGTRALVLNAGFFLASGATATVSHHANVGGSDYQIQGRQTILTSAPGQTIPIGFILEAGEILKLETTNTSSLNYNYCILEYPDTAPLKTVKLINLSSGNNTIYTCPDTYVAALVGLQKEPNFDAPNFYYCADGSQTRQWSSNIVSSGGSAGSTNKFTITATNTAANTLIQSAGVAGLLTPGDFWSVNVNTGNATQMAWTNILELPQ